MSVVFEQSQTRLNLMRAFAGEIQARNRYEFAAGVARRKGLQVIERVFTFTADQERAHAKVFYDFLAPLSGENLVVEGGYPVDIYTEMSDYLRAAQHNEYEEHDDAYASFAAVAQQEGFLEIAHTFRMIAAIEKTHGDRFGRFAELLEEKFAPCAFVCGDDFRFGYQAQGTPETLASATQVCVETVKLLKMDGEKISSTAIKNYLANGETEKANALLGEEFFLLGQVYKDRQVGRTINFPTANIRYPEDKFPIKKGVYETRVCVDGKEYKGITNYGARPTFDNTDTLTETYLDGFDGDLYGKELKVEFVRFLREITKFSGAEELKAQLTKDIEAVRK